jgi:hypothetical protein
VGSAAADGSAARAATDARPGPAAEEEDIRLVGVVPGRRGGLIVGGTARSLGASGFGSTADRISDGSYEVGVDIHPGRYKTVTPAEDNGSVCYAEVYTADDPLEPDTLKTEMTYLGLTIIDIPKKKGAIFWSEGCGEWKRTI